MQLRKPNNAIAQAHAEILRAIQAAARASLDEAPELLTSVEQAVALLSASAPSELAEPAMLAFSRDLNRLTALHRNAVAFFDGWAAMAAVSAQSYSPGRGGFAEQWHAGGFEVEG